MRLLLTGATGKVGRVFLERFLGDDRFSGWSVAALCNNRMLDPHERVASVKGSLANRTALAAAMRDVTHVVHMAAVKESPDLAMDVAVKGMFWLLEEMRQSKTARQFILIGGDCSVGHIFHGYDGPVTEHSPRRAYPGCYALTKVLEEVMLEQYQIQYDLNGCCLRAPWIMEKDDFRFAMAFGDEQFGGPPWSQLITPEEERKYAAEGRIPLLTDYRGRPLLRNFVHVADVASAVLAAIDADLAHQELFNIAMNRPVNYGEFAVLADARLGLGAAEIRTPYFSNWLDNSKARQRLDWEPVYDLERLFDESWAFKRAQNDPRRIWYPG
jgi:UDP-glucose 4-epimerase